MSSSNWTISVVEQKDEHNIFYYVLKFKDNTGGRYLWASCLFKKLVSDKRHYNYSGAVYTANVLANKIRDEINRKEYNNVMMEIHG